MGRPISSDGSPVHFEKSQVDIQPLHTPSAFEKIAPSNKLGSYEIDETEFLTGLICPLVCLLIIVGHHIDDLRLNQTINCWKIHI